LNDFEISRHILDNQFELLVLVFHVTARSMQHVH